MTEINDEDRRKQLLEFLASKEPAWKDEDHPELTGGSAEWVRKIRAEGERASQRRSNGKADS